MHNLTPEQRLDEAKAVFWQVILANDLLVRLVMDAVGQQAEDGQSASINLPECTGQLMLMGEKMEKFELQLEMSRTDSLLDGVVGFKYATFKHVEVMTLCEDVSSERALLKGKDGAYALVASDALWHLEARSSEKAEAMLALYEAWLELLRVIKEVDAHFDRAHGFTTKVYNYLVE